MNASARNELNRIIYELSSIISELDSISTGVRRDFKNIGNARCADSIDSVANKYRYVKRRLNNMDTETVTEWFASLNS